MKLGYLVGFLSLAAVCSRPANGSHHGATVTLSAKWASTATIHEAAEYLADDSSRKFWEFVDEWTNRGDESSKSEEKKDCLSQISCERSILTVAGKDTSVGELALLPAVLGSRKYSPRLEVFNSLAAESKDAPEACCWVDIHGQKGSTEEEVSNLLKAPATEPPPQLLTIDHVYHTTSSSSGSPQRQTVAILYASLGTGCFPRYHSLLSNAAESGGISYVLRPVLAHKACRAEAMEAGSGDCGGGCAFFGTGAPLQLPGFGVEMAVKNMEYSALDDSKSKEEAVEAEADAVSASTDTEGFLFNRLLERLPGSRTELLTFREALLASSTQEQKLKVWELKDLGVQAALRVVTATDPLAALTDVAQNFPKLASPLSRLEVSEGLRRAVSNNGRLLPGGSSYMLLNGQFVDVADANLFSLLDLVQQEMRLGGQLQMTGLQSQDIAQLLTLRSGASDGPSHRDAPSRIDIGPSNDVSGGPSRDHVVWLNDLEEDKQYAQWPRRLRDLLQPAFGGQMPLVGRNLFHVTVVADLATSSGLAAAAAAVQSVHDNWPIRVGLLPPARVAAVDAVAPWTELDASAQASAAATAASLQLGSAAALAFVESLAQSASIDVDDEGALKPSNFTSSQIDREFLAVWQRFSAGTSGAAGEGEPHDEAPPMAAETALEQLHDGKGFAEGILQKTIDAARFSKDRGLKGSPVPTATMNGALIEAPSSEKESAMLWRQLLMNSLQHELRQLQEWVYYEKLKESMQPLLPHILKLTGAVQRHNPRILPSPESSSGASSESGTGAEQHKLSASLLAAVEGSKQSPYIHQPGSLEEVKAVTHWVVVDVATMGGAALVSEAMRFMSGGAGDATPSRLAVVHNPADPAAPLSPLHLLTVAAAALPARRQKLPGFLLALLTNTTLTASLAGGDGREEPSMEEAVQFAASQGLNDKALRMLLADTAALTQAATSATTAVRDHFNLAAGACAIITNGRTLPVNTSAEAGDEEVLLAGDFALLQSHAVRRQLGGGCATAVGAALDGQRISPLQGRGEDSDGDGDEELSNEQLSDIVAQASSILASSGFKSDSRSSHLTAALSELHTEHVAVMLPAVEGAGSPLNATIIIDPLSKAAQRLAPLLSMLREQTGMGIHLILNPASELSDLPLKSYYRYALPRLSGGSPEGPAAIFEALPGQQVLTLNMDVPEAWLVEAVEAEADLDNLKLSELPSSMAGGQALQAKFQLEALLLTGQCIDHGAATRQQVTPRGVQLWAGRGEEVHMRDTLVMSNLGYFQLQTSPGAWTVHLAPGRSRDLYHVIPNGPPLQNGTTSAPALIESLQGRRILLSVRKNEGKEEEDVLDSKAATETSSIWGSIFNGAPAARGVGDQRVHVFTVASGHMYERLQKIMILSVLRNTKSRLKVWFIKNYMSPQMRAFVPHMAKHYGFDFELVTYKWPSWLHKQTDKQRIIWAYKILFLDVLFPLDLEKVIFLDADQVIRTDIKALSDLDLKGAPYGYTPFCDNNKDMDGFRFWRQGFWKNHLRGRPYHISALYVIDLVRFRQTAAGDQLRIIYDQLSKDPNSLSNLDQDLPNYAQHQVKIFSLPQEWLWCETWCGNTTKADAKTIDLCNNPLTKEPKLDSARRIVAEWPALDEEARDFTRKVERQLADEVATSLSDRTQYASKASGLEMVGGPASTTAPEEETVAGPQAGVVSKDESIGTTDEVEAVGEAHAPHLKALKDQIKFFKAKLDNARTSEDYVQMAPAKQVLLRRRMDLAARCVMQKEEAACAAIKKLPELSAVDDDTDPLSFLTAQEIEETEAAHARKMKEAADFAESNEASKAKLAELHKQHSPKHDEL